VRTSFELNKAQQARFERFKQWCESKRELYDECLGAMSPFLFTFRPGSIADDVVVWCGEVDESSPSVNLSMDDDGEFVKPETNGRIWK